MNQKITILTSLILLIICTALSAQTGPSTDRPDSLRIFAGSGVNQILIPVADSLQLKNPEIEIVSTNTALLEIIDIGYTPGQSVAIARVEEKGTTGKVNFIIAFNYDGKADTLHMDIHIMPYQNPGMTFEIHDIVFWQEAIPLSGVPVYETIIQTSEGPYNQLNYKEIPLTVSMDCNNPAVCTGHDFYTAFYKGYIVAPVSGTYHFYMRSADNHSLWLSTNHEFGKAQKLLSRSDKYGRAGTEIGNNTAKSAPVQLEAGKVYAIYATQWIIHSTYGGIMWDGPGINMSYIQGTNMMPVYDTVKPTAPENFVLEWKSSTSMAVKWNPSTDNTKVSGYNIYINGFKANSSIIRETSYRIDNLQENTKYNLVVTSTDRAGNESLVSSVLEAETFSSDDTPPTPPTQLEVLEANGLALRIKWSGATDNETEVIGYNLYINGELYNINDFLFSNEVIVRNLYPETTYKVTIESVDAGMNISEKSNEFEVATVAFDATGPLLGEKMGKVVVSNLVTSWNEGMGLNGPYENGDMVNNETVRQLVREYGAGAIRWGAISANSKSLQGSTGTGKANTYGKMLNFANELGARFALTVGVKDGIDYRTNPNTFLHLLEYLAGDASTTWGAIRASEGFTEPLLQQGKGIFLEFGNEVWGAAAHDAEIGSDYAVYAKWVRDMSDVVRSSPYYDPEKIIMVYSGRYPHPNSSYGVNTKVLTGDRGHAESLGVSGYMGGNLSYDPEIPKGDSELDYYKNSIDMARNNMEGFVLTMKETLSLTGTLKTFYLYETNMTTSSYNGRFGQAVVLTDYLANSMNYGSIIPTIFHLTGGEWRITQPADNYRKLPLYHAGKLFNRFCKGHIMKTDFISNNRITNSAGKNINYDAVGAYSYNSGENFSVMMVNRDFENEFTVALELPADLTFADEATIYTMWEDDFSSFNANIDSVTVTITDNMLVKIPKHSIVIVNFRGEDPGYEQLPLGYFERKRPESLSITSTRNFLIDTNRGSDMISTQVLPADAFNATAVIDVVENTTQSILTPFSGGRMHIKGSGICGDDGHITFYIYAADNHELNDTVTVYVTNQGTGCPTTGAELIGDGTGIMFYPNPVSDKLHINKTLDSRCYVQVIDINGKSIYQNYLENSYEIPVSGLKSGIYILGVFKPDGSYVSGRFMKK